MKAMGQEVPSQKRTLELNPDHESGTLETLTLYAKGDELEGIAGFLIAANQLGIDTTILSCDVYASAPSATRMPQNQRLRGTRPQLSTSSATTGHRWFQSTSTMILLHRRTIRR